MAMNDKEIIQLYFERNENAIRATSEKYGKYCFSIANNILNSKEDTEECVSDAYLKIWNLIPPNRPQVLRTFLGKIVRNEAFDLYRKMTSEKRGNGQLEVVLDELEQCISGGYEPDVEFEKKELLYAINSFLETLSEEKCAIFVRRYWYAESVQEIAKRYGMSENNVSVNLNRIRKKLQNYLTERRFQL